jgi:predicted dehydrogenase
MAKQFHAVVVGAGGISRAWFPRLKKEKVAIDAVVDLNPAAAEARLEEFQISGAQVSDDLKATLKKHQPDFVLDLTVPEAHCQVTCTALKSGCHVIGEKPMANSMAEARKMVRTSQETGKLYMVSQSRRWMEIHDQIARTVAQGKIGPVTAVNCAFYLGAGFFSGFRSTMDSVLILDMAIHHFDLARMMTGLDPVSVYCKEYSPSGSWYKGDAAATCIFEMSNGALFTYAGSWCAMGMNTPWAGDWRIVGQKGSILYENETDPVGELSRWSKAKHPKKISKPLKPAPKTLKYKTMHGALREMLTFLRGGKMPQTHCRDNIKSFAMVMKAIESSRRGRAVKIDALD